VPLHEWTELQEKPHVDIITWVFEEGSFVPCARLTETSKESIVADYLGTPTQMYDDEGKKTWSAELDIYGRIRTFDGRSLNSCPFRFQGQYEDAETGLYYNRFRYYDPSIGCYLSQDPIGLAGGNPTLYGYVKDTNSWIDPLGLDCRTKKDPLRRDKHGNPIPDPEAKGVPHTQLGTKQGRNGAYKQAREFDSNGKPVRDIDFTDHGRPQNHSNPHQHKYIENPTGGTRSRSKKAEPLD
jgi:RHS repeat-associated protein